MPTVPAIFFQILAWFELFEFDIIAAKQRDKSSGYDGHEANDDALDENSKTVLLGDTEIGRAHV